MARGSALRLLADNVGILPDYVDQTGTERRVTTDETRVAILRAMGIEASTEEMAAAALESLRERERDEIMSPVRVVEADDAHTMTVELRIPASLSRSPRAAWRLEVIAENGERRAREGRCDGRASLQVALPMVPSLGYHRVNVRLGAGSDEWSGEQSLVVVPPRCTTPEALLAGARVFGVIANH
jgi:4-alpha-glucanotransferase